MNTNIKKKVVAGGCFFCPHCSSDKIKKNGKRKGIQRFFCKNCDGSFTKNSALLQEKISFKNCIHSGLDFLSFLTFDSRRVKMIDFFSGLNDTNTDTRTVNFFGQEFNLLYKKTNHGEALLFNFEGENLFSCEKASFSYKTKLLKIFDDRVVFNWSFYGAFFSFIRLGIFKKSFLKNFLAFPSHVSNQPHVTRLDFCFDFIDYTVPQIVSFYNVKNKRSTVWQAPDGSYETVYFGDSRISKNNKFLIRIYDKLKDVEGKEKERFFTDYFKYDNVTRFEIETRSTSLRDFDVKFEYIFDDKEIYKLIKAMLSTKFSNFHFDFSGIEFLARRKSDCNDACYQYFFARFKSLYMKCRGFGKSHDEIFDSLRGVEC